MSGCQNCTAKVGCDDRKGQERAVLAETRGGLSFGIGLLAELFFGVAFLVEAVDRMLVFDFVAFALVRDFGFAFADASALAFRLKRRCTLVIASTNSSFRIPCQPETP